MPRFGRRSLTRRTLIAVAIRISIVVAAASVLSFLHVQRGLETQALQQLRQHVQERGARESAIFELAADNLQTFAGTYFKRLGAAGPKNALARFDHLFETRPDGTTRVREAAFEATGISGFIGRYAPIDDDLRIRLAIAYEVLAQFGPAWQHRFVNLYVITPEQAVLMYWPDQPWALDASDWEVFGKLELVAPPAGERDVLVLGEQTSLPKERGWSELYYDYGVNDWLVSATLPLVAGERHLLSVGHDILLRELIERTLGSGVDGTYTIVVAPDGRLIVHPAYMEAIQAESGGLFVEETGDPHLARIVDQAKELREQVAITENEEDGEFLAVTRLAGPDWLLINVFPQAIVTNQAFETARLILIVGLVALVVELLILFQILRAQVASPLRRLIEAARGLAAGRFGAPLPTDRQDEFGELARDFDFMANEVRDRERALSERTVTLADVNQRLERELAERERAEAVVARQREALHQSEKLNALGSLLAGVAHELNNPLSVVVGRASMLEERLRERPEGRAVGKIRDAAERCVKIVRTFVAMARQQEPSREPVRIGDLLEGTLDVVGFGLRREGIELELDVDPDLPPLLADGGQLTQVFTNLMVNAQHALQESPPPRLIRVSGRAEPGTGTLVLEVADNGPGIPPELLSRIFEPFFTTKPQGQGTGLGLAVCRGMVEAHGGTLDVDSAPGEGATFRIRLPLKTAASDQIAAAAELGRGSGTVLIVEDEPDIRDLLEDILATAGYRVEAVGSAADALARLEGTAADVVLCDLRMPDQDGTQLFRELQTRDPDLAQHLVFVTGDSLSEAAEQLLSATGRPVIEKPFSPDDVRRAVAAQLRSRAGPEPEPARRAAY